ncbi:MAG: hypothetical protein U0L84_01110 [Acutalibacteraceae bacterium]|nr:hypothetical protein [Acutalibacteraceae bacterium]
MPKKQNEVTPAIEDISSTSEEFRANKNPVDAYVNGIYKNTGNIIKAIAFIICFCIIVLSFVAAFFLYTKSTLSIAISIGVLLIGTIFSLIVFYPLYGLGCVICQNNEILKKLNDK